MANVNLKPSRVMPNLLHVMPTFASEDKTIINTVFEINHSTINKYELINQTGHILLDRVGYSTLAYPIGYGAIPQTWDLDNDLLDVIFANVTEPIMPGVLVEGRIIGVMKFNDGGETDDKIICVVNSDKRQDHIQSYADLGAHWEKENRYYWEHYKDLKKPGTCTVEGFFDTATAIEIIEEAMHRYEETIKPQLDD